MDPLGAGELSIVPSRVGGVLSLAWGGKSNDRHPERTIGGYLDRALAFAREASVAIEHRFEGMAFFNSSTIAVVIHHVHAARAAGVKVALVYAADVQWQRVSFEALRILVKDDGSFALRPI